MEPLLTFDQLPNAVTMLTKEVSELKRLIIEKQDLTHTEPPEQLLTIQEAAEFLHLSVPTIYSKVSKRELPVCKAPGSKRLYFYRTELLDYIKTGRKKSNADIEAEATAYLSNNKKRLNNGK
jgi:excisionase family DNA binding protein